MAWHSPAMAQDKLFPIKGATVNGTVEEVTHDKVVIKARNGNQNFPTDQIGWLIFEGEASAAQRAKELASREQYIDAMAELKKIDQGSLDQENAKKEYLYYRGFLEGQLALRGRGDPKKASEDLLEYLRGNANSFHFYQAAETLGLLAVQMGQYDKASKYFKGLAKSPFPILAARSRYLESNSLLTQADKQNEARAICNELLAMNATEPEVSRMQLLAKVNVARCDIAEGKVEEVLRNLDKMIQEGDSSDAELFSKISNAQGQCHLALKKPNQAILAFLHTEYFYSGIPDAHAEALYNLSQLWKGRNDLQRSAEAQEKLVKLYSGSSWAKKK